MPLTSGHLVEEINGTRCTIIEKGIDEERLAFLTRLLEGNGLEVKVAEMAPAAEGEPKRYTLGVTSLQFNPTIAVYQMALKTADGEKVTPAYWEQRTTQIDPEYWMEDKR